ncbi:MAG: sulfatase-like hydrolase/transferase, partial [Rubripirellula sp.]
MNRFILILSLCLVASPQITGQDAAKSPRPGDLNVLFIAVDDLRPQLGCYGKAFMHTPHFDRLAKRSVLFERAYCMVPTCGASRASLMTGVRPSPTRFVSYTARADQEAPQAIPLNRFFKSAGYETISLGKVFHFTDDSLDGWSQKPWRPQTSDFHDRAAERAAIKAHRAKYPNRKKVRGKPYESFDAPDEEYRDHETASQAISHLTRLGKSKKPFFLAVGFPQPHLPFCAPKQYWDLYD